MLIVFGGLPGTGKTTLATGYEVAYALAIRRHIEAAARSTP
jgi:2-phosphoglycerate kinase